MADISSDALGWDDEAQAVDSEYTILTPGTYSYRVDGFQRGHFDGSDKMGACPMATLDLACANARGEQSTVSTRLYLSKRQMWKLTAFFKSARLIPLDLTDGAAYRMPWDKVVGATGEVEIANREYNGRTYNDVRRFVVPDAPKKTYGAL